MMKISDSFNDNASGLSAKELQLQQLRKSADALVKSAALLQEVANPLPPAKTIAQIKPNKPGDLYSQADEAINAFYNSEQAEDPLREKQRKLAEFRAQELRAQEEQLISDDKLIPGYIAKPYLHDLDKHASGHREWIKSRQADYQVRAETTCPFLELPHSRPYYKGNAHVVSDHHPRGYSILPKETAYDMTVAAQGHYALPHVTDVAGNDTCKKNLTKIEMYLWGDDNGDIARRLVLCHAGDDGKYSRFRDETYVGGQCRHYAVYTQSGKMLQEVYIAPDGSSQLFKPGLLERIGRAIGAMMGQLQERPEQPMLQDLRHAGAVSSVMGILTRSHVDVAVSVASSLLSMRALLADDHSSKAEFDQRFENNIIPEYTRRVSVARELAGAYEALQASLKTVAQMRDNMANLPVVQGALNKLIGDKIEAYAPHKMAIDIAQKLLAADDNRHAEVRKVGEAVRQAITAVRKDPVAFDAIYRELANYYERKTQSDSVYPQLCDARDSLRQLAQKVDAGLYDYMQQVSNQAETAANYIRSVSPHVDPLANFLSPIDDVKPLPVTDKNRSDAPRGKKG